MRIISGRFKGKRITAPKKLPVRPTTDMAKEGLFNILNNHFFFEELRVLDLFTGTGNISYEFVSRGAKKITAVDTHMGCVTFVEKVAKELNASINVVKSDVFRFLKKDGERYDIIFADPPYNFSKEEFASIPTLVFEHGLLEQDGMLIVEHSDHTDLSAISQFMESRRYGGNSFSFFRCMENT